MTGGLLLVHAHPDDESITTGGTIAHYSALGVPVTVVTCTLGEEGEVIGERWAGLVADRADQLGGYRVLELTSALDALDAAPPRFLGGAGRWRDSGMAGTPAADKPGVFVRSGAEAVEALTKIVLELRPSVVVGYDPNGGYGHPDHIRAHEITTEAVHTAAELGWDTPKFYWTVTDGDRLRERTAALVEAELPSAWRLPREDELASVPSDTVTTTLDICAALPAKRAALRAHATQVTVAPSGRGFALSNLIAQPLLPEEHFTLVRGALGPVDADGRENDLFAGITTPYLGV
ncbi:N-acetyl-1-D-myo-inositol-2-amino-2-deoxy-alpha-D-glucopyranoside deacetylase [Nocardia callitridis]|uniref:1D-myo-inositol 2-acetamido-2-deoxy-alpha-D-glucopyranoside deacetylase n=1 Tax=Nocardia callitridis TaxID=648753 RepID=A0ABP9JTU7_9NOCA